MWIDSMLFDVDMFWEAAIPHDLVVRAAILVAALLLDALVGDPHWLWGRVPHPVVLFGWTISMLERLFNRPRLARINITGRMRRSLGVLVILMLVGGAATVGGAIAAVASTVGMPLTVSVELLLVAILLAGRSLADHARAVATALEDGTLEEARFAVAKIVGRNPESLDEPAISRATIESIAENLSDGLIAPAIFYLTLGLPGIFAYKMINTADSMVGYRSARLSAFGWGSARLDDIANLVPARITGTMIAIAEPRKAWRSISVMLRDAPHHRSPNAGWPEAAMAAQVNLSLAGPRSYGLRKSSDREMNKDGIRTADHTHLVLSLELMWRTVIVFALMVTMVGLVWSA